MNKITLSIFFIFLIIRSGFGQEIKSDSTKFINSLENRKIIHSDSILSKQTHRRGRVNIKLCVNSEGEVIEAIFLLSGSTTDNQELVELALEHVNKLKFDRAETEKQCGTMAIIFGMKK